MYRRNGLCSYQCDKSAQQSRGPSKLFTATRGDALPGSERVGEESKLSSASGGEDWRTSTSAK